MVVALFLVNTNIVQAWWTCNHTGVDTFPDGRAAYSVGTSEVDEDTRCLCGHSKETEEEMGGDTFCVTCLQQGDRMFQQLGEEWCINNDGEYSHPFFTGTQFSGDPNWIPEEQARAFRLIREGTLKDWTTFSPNAGHEKNETEISPSYCHPEHLAGNWVSEKFALGAMQLAGCNKGGRDAMDFHREDRGEAQHFDPIGEATTTKWCPHCKGNTLSGSCRKSRRKREPCNAGVAWKGRRRLNTLERVFADILPSKSKRGDRKVDRRV